MQLKKKYQRVARICNQYQLFDRFVHFALTVLMSGDDSDIVNESEQWKEI